MMDIQLRAIDAPLSADHVLVLFVDQEQVRVEHPLLSTTLSNLINTHIERAGFSAKLGETLPIYQLVDTDLEQILLVGAGSLSKMTTGQAQTLAQSTYKALSARASHVDVVIDTLPQAVLPVFSLALMNAGYSFQTYKSKKTEAKLAQIQLLCKDPAQHQASLDLMQAIHQGQNVARDLANEPANVCFPEYMAEQAQALAAQYPDLLNVTVLTHADMQDLGMNTFLAVSKGSEREGRLVIVQYTGKADGSAPIALVGKGVTFDTGGISIKPAASMDEMKFDMAGAAAVMGVLRALCEARLPINVVGAMACAENMPSGRATRPGDIVTSMSGQTVEILNTDAEGRLVLCDTLTYIERYNPALVIDIATLTGACIVALGKVVAGLFSPDDQLAQDLQNAGLSIHDRVWRMPVLDDYQDLLDSPVADIGNIGNGGPYAGAITAACFLARFTKQYRWAHLDIAGVSHVSGGQKGATGRPVPLLMQFLANQAAATGAEG